MKIKKNDNVVVIAGKDRGKSGKVLDSFPRIGKIVVEGVALRKKHQRPRKEGQKGQVISMPAPIDASNAMLFCKNCGKGVSVGYELTEGKKTRVCKKCKNEI
ncbi:50S ribosomal protein L24 [Candidatus Giovannonibacteria bacterium]|nr:50S ribosomal protein L24 [Candidatus Giovannonibacteria bacterium]